MGLALLYAYRSQTPSVPEVDITRAIQDVNAGKIKTVTIIASNATLDFKDTSLGKEQTTLQEPDTLMAKAVADYNASHADSVALKIGRDNQTFNVVGSILLSLLPVLLIGGFFFYMMRQAQGTNNQALSFGKSRARMFIGNKPTVTFDDVAGVEEAKQELTEVVEFLKYPEKFSSLGAPIPPDVLDPALLRPGRFDRQVVLDRPDIKGRKAILDVHVRGKPLDKNVELLRIAQISPGFSGADLANVVNEAAILAARRNKKTIAQIDFEEALEKVALGPERRSRVITEKEKWIVAYHEAGHALCFKLLKHTNPVHKISIVARGMAMGVTWSLPQEDRYFRTRAEFEDDIAAALGGWVAEQLHLGGDVTTGASNDIEKASHMARQMVTKFGMSEKLGPLQYGKSDELIFLGRQIQEERNYSEDVAKIIDSEVHDIVERGRHRAYEVLTQNRDKLDRVVNKLIEQETLETDEFNRLFGDDGGTPVAAPTPDTMPPGAPAGEERRREKGEKGKGPAPAPTPA